MYIYAHFLTWICVCAREHQNTADQAQFFHFGFSSVLLRVCFFVDDHSALRNGLDRVVSFPKMCKNVLKCVLMCIVKHFSTFLQCRCAIPQNFAVFVFETVKLGKACSTVQKTLPDNTIRPLNMQDIRTHNTMALCSVNLHKNVLKCTSKTFHHISLPPVWW